MSWFISLRYRLCLVIICVTLLAPHAARSQIIIDPPPVPPVPLPVTQLRIQEQRVDVLIDGVLAQVHLTQQLVNDSPMTIEGNYLLPLPEDAAIGDFQMTVDGAVIEGEILRAEEARRAYEEIVRQRRDPALLAYLGHDLFQVNIFPIPAGETRTLSLSYSHLLPAQDGLYQFRYPLQTRQLTSAPVDSLAITVELVNQPGLRTIYSTNHTIATERISDSRALVGYEATNTHPEGDFVLYFGTDERTIGVNVLSYQSGTDDGYFVLLAAPSVETVAATVVQRDLIMVLDVSGSMQGEKMTQAIDAAHYVVDHLNPNDRFNLIAFSTGVRLWNAALQPVNGATQRAAHAWIDRLAASGGTDINRALVEALEQVAPQPLAREEAGERPAYLLFMTDGLPTQGERETNHIIDNVLTALPSTASVRLFNFGVGYDVNTTLLDTLSSELGGRSSYVRPEERIDEVVSHFYQGISRPILSEVEIEIGAQAAETGTVSSVLVDEIYPFPLPDLFAGEQLVIAGRYHATQAANDRDALPIMITLRGQVNGEPLLFRYPGHSFVQQGGEPNLARLWASRKIGSLLQQIRRYGAEAELIDAIVELSLQYGIVTPYTSSFVPEPIGQAADHLRGDDPLAPLVPANELAAAYTAGAVDTDVASQRVQRAVGAEAVTMSERIGELKTTDVAENSEAAKFAAGRVFVPTGVDKTASNPPLTRWIDTRYNEMMTLQPVRFGSDCYFDLLATPEMAEWLAVAPELILVLDEQHALLISIELDDAETQVCPIVDEIVP